MSECFETMHSINENSPFLFTFLSRMQNFVKTGLKNCIHNYDAESLQRLRSGSQPRLIVPRSRLCTIGDRCFRVMAASAWNSLPTSVTTATSLFSFKRQLKTFLFTKSFPELQLNCVPCPRSTFAHATLISTF